MYIYAIGLTLIKFKTYHKRVVIWLIGVIIEFLNECEQNKAITMKKKNNT